MAKVQWKTAHTLPKPRSGFSQHYVCTDCQVTWTWADVDSMPCFNCGSDHDVIRVDTMDLYVKWFGNERAPDAGPGLDHDRT